MALQLTIVTPKGQAFHGTVESVVLPGTEGEFGVLPGHVRFVAPLRVGEAQIRQREGVLSAALSEGFAEVDFDRAVVMAETCELAHDIDLARAERARARAEHALTSLRDNQHEEHLFKLEEAALLRASNRISVARKGTRGDSS